ncbi:MAG: response regulator [Fimbriimonadaceae bacterium]|nr:response regulator [Alphaproteobacteria bacterium]
MSKIAFDRISFLVVDDNSHMRRLVRSLLHGFGSRQVFEAEDGAAGLEGVETYAPDILITDWAMPIFDGLELVQMIRNPDSCKNAYIPIIMLTGHSEKERVTQARDLGVTEFLCKPISAKALYDRIFNIVMNPRPYIRTASFFGPDRRRNSNANYTGKERRKAPETDQDDIDALMNEEIDDVDALMVDEAGSQDSIDALMADDDGGSQDDIDALMAQ